jgi:ribosomal protein S18 acetylase RimI-like enzyme
VRRLLPGDEPALIACAAVDHEFEDDLEPVEPSPPLEPEAASIFLADPAVRFWLAESGGQPVGQLHCCVIALGNGDHELLLYSIGTRTGWRRRGIASALVASMTDLMQAEGLTEVWVGSAPNVTAFYEACGFAADEGVFMVKTIGPAP